MAAEACGQGDPWRGKPLFQHIPKRRGNRPFLGESRSTTGLVYRIFVPSPIQKKRFFFTFFSLRFRPRSGPTPAVGRLSRAVLKGGPQGRPSIIKILKTHPAHCTVAVAPASARSVSMGRSAYSTGGREPRRPSGGGRPNPPQKSVSHP